jgi:hypothetical protein
VLGVELLAFFVILLVIPSAVILISSTLRKTSPKAGFVALGWAVLIYWVSALVGAYVGGSSANGVFWLLGTVLTAIVAARDGYRWGMSWLWFILPGIGWWLLLWARNNQLDRRRAELAAIRPADASAGPA